jgi:flagellar motor switch protein FliG
LAQPEEIRPDPFAFLSELSRGQIAHLIKDEPVRVKAILLSRIAPEDIAHILESYPKEMQLEVAVQIGNFHALPLDAVSDIARNLAEKARKLPDEKTVDIEGPKALADLMSRASTGTIRYLLDAMKAKDRKLSAEIEKRFFLFDAIPMVPDDALPQVVRRLPSQVVLQAIQGSDPALQRKVIMAFPEQARTGMVTSLRGAKFDAKTVMEARQLMVSRFQQAASEGRIDLKAIIDAWQNQAKAS